MTTLRVWGGLFAASALFLAACGGSNPTDLADASGTYAADVRVIERQTDASESDTDEPVSIVPPAGAVLLDDVAEDVVGDFEGEQAQGMRVEVQSASASLIKPRDIAAAPAPVLVELGAASEVERSRVAAVPRSKNTDSERRPVAIGFGRLVESAQAQQASAQMQWRTLADERQAAALGARAAGAQALRVGVRFDSLPLEAVVRFYAPGADSMLEYPAAHVRRVISGNREAGLSDQLAQVFWGPMIDGDTAVVEVVLPATTPRTEAAFSLAQVVQMDQTTQQAAQTASQRVGQIGASDSCQIDAICDPAAANSTAAKAALFLSYVEYDAFGFAWSYMCTGTLVTDAARSGAAYVLTADHCISNQVTARTLQAYQYHRSTTCGADVADGRLALLPGYVDYLYSEKRGTGTDVSLLSLNAHGSFAMDLAGWNAATVAAATNVSVFHHPSGDLLKYSRGVARNKDANYLRVVWNPLEGVTEGGSSGSGLLNPSGQVIGTLWGGSSYCDDPFTSVDESRWPDEYGRFSAAYGRGLRKWLHTPAYKIGGMGDLDGDGHKDLLWYQKFSSAMQTVVSRHDSAANVTGWINPHVEGASSYHDLSANLVAMRDINGDGKDDLIYKIPNDAGDRYSLVAQYKDGAGTWRYFTLQSGITNTIQVLGYVDMDGNGVKDLVLYNTKSENFDVGGVVRKMKQVVIVTYSLSSQQLARLGAATYLMYPQEKPVAAGDFWGDGKGELVWRNPNWPRDLIISDKDGGVQVIGNGYVSFPGTVIGVDDFDGDGKDDLAFNNAGQVNYVYGEEPIAGARFFGQSRRAIGAVPTGFSLAAVGDIDGDGKADTVWRKGADVRVARSATLPVSWQKLNLLQ